MKKMTPTALVRSAYGGNTTKVLQMLEKAKNIEQKILRKVTKNRRKLRHGLIRQRTSTTLELEKDASLLRRNVLDVDATNARGQTGLAWAARQGHGVVVDALVRGHRTPPSTHTPSYLPVCMGTARTTAA